MRAFTAAIAVALLSATGAQAQTAPAPAAASATAAPATTAYSVEDTEIGTLLDDPAAKAILDKHMPSLSTSEQIDMARSMTLTMVQQYAPDKVTEQALAAVQADLAKLPVKQ